ncbi:MAG: hypothetical protein NDJ89_03250 [Oligoflexia bacterium]|nr:hypothetical protein [Oligoflexia bacterium]
MTYSPWLGTLTALFEVLAGIWALGLQGRRKLLTLIAATLFLLAGYQALEVFICSATGTHQLFLSRMAFLDVTWLPPLSLLLISELHPSAPRWLRRFAWASVAVGALFSFWIVVDTRFVTGTICQFMYARYRHIEPWFHFYGAFYEITQMSMIFIPAALLPHIEDPSARKHLGDLLIGSLLFILPSLFLAAVLPSLFETALPSLMCHFAAFYAIFLVRIAYREDRREPALAMT